MELDLVLYHDHADEIVTLEMSLEAIRERTGINCRLAKAPERYVRDGTLGDGTPIPLNAVVYVHGNHTQKYPYFSAAVTLPQRRPDIRVIIGIDGERYRESSFTTVEEYQLAKRLLEQGFGPQHPVSISRETIIPFFHGRNPVYPSYEIKETFEKYVTMLKALREGGTL